MLLLQSTATAAAAASSGHTRWPAQLCANSQLAIRGGTTFVVAIASDPTTVLERAEFPTTMPKETLRKCCEWLASRHYDALGVASSSADAYVRQEAAAFERSKRPAADDGTYRAIGGQISDAA